MKFYGLFHQACGVLCALTLALALTPAVAGAQTTGGGFFSRLNDLDSKDWFVSNFRIKNPSFRTGWSRSAVWSNPADGALILSLSPTVSGANKDFVGGEVQRRQPTSYGHYEIVMTAARGEGVISSFFTYTGPYFGNPHDEIDFEFLGRDTTKVWVNRFVGGKKLPGQWLDLGFDASEDPHLYSFDWQPDSLTWSVDGRELLRVTADEVDIPALPQKIYINIWGGAEGQRNWSGVAPRAARAQARYYCMSYRPLGASTRRCSDLPGW
ncbi:family 16 glycosylhydrolase [Ruegeria sp. 2012CJ41-6]|uniref:Beta-glucanase n=1 Tax=Ruegeria spongiae TaxID=2942209 RepID=A0ABT0Q6X2_9RHOB|nr:family 16 glycosylhydrolase [Ruegeria spongiae]MCL6285629.1 family 16 glycosylhydrolase [Ruegeria spongiae]